ncbi:MAG TPA: DUF6220 domain-containing protein [Chloroflexota bacterium]|nr:DUF6220 domain-containing protein [Chloroflexota bacterium]
MTRALRAMWALLIWLFVLAIPVQFYLAGHGAMEGAHAADKSIKVMPMAWDPHAALGTLMGLLAILIVLVALAGRVPQPLLGLSALLLVFMVIQFFLPFFNDSAATRPVAALHAVNALVVTGLAIMLAVRSRQYLPWANRRPAPEGMAAPAAPQ